MEGKKSVPPRIEEMYVAVNSNEFETSSPTDDIVTRSLKLSKILFCPPTYFELIN